MPYGIKKGSDCIVTNLEEVVSKCSHAVAAVRRAIALGYVINAKVCRAMPKEDIVELGTIVGYNGKPSDLYGGDRYPIIVQWENYDPLKSTGCFEYALDDVDLVEVPKELTPYCVHQIPASSNLAVQDDISGDRPRALKLPFELRKQFDNGGSIPMELDPRWYGYVWVESREEAITVARSLMS